MACSCFGLSVSVYSFQYHPSLVSRNLDFNLPPFAIIWTMFAKVSVEFATGLWLCSCMQCLSASWALQVLRPSVFLRQNLTSTLLIYLGSLFMKVPTSDYSPSGLTDIPELSNANTAAINLCYHYPPFTLYLHRCVEISDCSWAAIWLFRKGEGRLEFFF